MTNEEAIVVLQKIKPIPHRGDSKSTTHILETIALEMAINALEQEDVLDKIRAEIEQITDTMGVSYNQYVSKIDVLQIIDKYKAESEGEE